MSRQRTTYQVWYQEAIDDPDEWQKYGGRLWSKEAAQQRVNELRGIRPTRKYRITQSISIIDTSVIESETA